MATKKSVAVFSEYAGGPAGTSPGDTLEYAIALNVSDYFALDTLVLTDKISDGQALDGATGNATLTISREGTAPVTYSFTGANVTHLNIPALTAQRH